MDRITKSFVTDFIKLHEIESKKESTDFENFVNYTIVKNEYSGTFDISDVSTGESTQGIDGIAILVNGKLADSPEEITDLINLNKYLEVEFLFIQSKTSPSFEGTEMGNFLFSVKNFFSETPSIINNDEMATFHEIYQKIYDNSPKMTKGKPKLKLFYVTTGTWNSEKSQLAVVENGKDELKRLGYFSDIEFNPIDSTSLQNLYRKTKELSKATFVFKDKVTLPEISGVKESYFGIIPWEEFKQIIIDEKSNIKNIFYDNVRDYLGANPVNESISQTIKNEKYDLFTVLNNGVTIVASDLVPAGNRFTINDYQIVNGCQTSHVLFSNRENIGISNIYIPVRLIITDNEDVKNEVTIATNNQTAIKPEQLAALSQFQKDLEEYYKTFEEDNRLYYERRTNQYNANDEVLKSRIITIPKQIKTFASMFLELPHIVYGYYGTIMRNNGDSIFISGHSLYPYYISSFTLFKLEQLFKSGLFDKKYRKAKYHILMLFRRFCNPDQVPQFNSVRKIERYCITINDILKDEQKTIEMFRKCLDKIDSSGLDINDKYAFKPAESTKRLKE